ncbi:LysM peptidoglycan-binding domain-containing protein [Balneolaceae bacterium YR4-1]|uniref:LysM peptidoglycan-binding domain-containing protein n=1 Tax=Halalkalibaculum roseum TaxID=2709311 RepID=A0A6M1SVJ5_9BACT|nr:LysM peptidoglycan-binding domain-containing protein [Halalkalibaculum roseum]NGP76882.1 LysM peptidoglycan-binding domain-containing protein [Halalkalibaculum roseum]
MNTFLKFLRSALLLLVLLSLFTSARAQILLDSLDADLFVTETIDGQRVQKMLGNAYIISLEEDIEIFSDSIYRYINLNEIRAYGNIQINTENEKIWSDSLVYFTDIDFTQLRGRVIIEADSTTLFGSSVDYRFSNKVAHFIDNIRLEDPEGILTANSGFYYREADSAVFRGQVQLRDTTQYIEGDSLFSNRGEKYYEMYGEIFAVDGDNNSTLKGDYLEADASGRRLLRGNAWLKNISEDTTGTAQSDSIRTRPPIMTSFRPDSVSLRPDTLSDVSDSVAVIADDEDSIGQAEALTHRVRAGETLFGIARNYNVTVDSLKKWNNFSGNNLNTGQNLLVKPPESVSIIKHTVRPKETLFSLSREYQVTIEQIKSWNSLTSNNLNVGQELTFYKDSLNGESIYIVERGDNLFQIARDYNMTVEELRELNNLTTNNITAGQELRVKTTDSTNFSIDTVASDTTNVPVYARAEVPEDSLRSPRSAGIDTTHIRASRILSQQYSTPTDTSTIVNAYENVRIWSRKFSAISDTSRYDDREETFELWSNAKTWHEQVQLSGPYIKVFLQDGEIDQLRAFPKPFAVQQDTSLNRLNQIKGDTLNAYFTGGDLREIHVFGGSHLLRFTKNDQGDPDGAIDLTAPSTRIFFEDGELVEMKSLGTINGSYLPQSEQTSKRQLEGFIWTPDLQPQRPQEKMIPRFPPVPEVRPFELPRRYVNYIDGKTDQ